MWFGNHADHNTVGFGFYDRIVTQLGIHAPNHKQCTHLNKMCMLLNEKVTRM